MFESIVVGVDGSEASEKAIRIACDLAQKYKAGLHLVHSPQPETAVYATAAVAGFPAVAEMPTQEELDQAGEEVMKLALATAAEAGQPDVQTHMLRGDPADQLIDCAERVGADLIVTGRRGLGNLAGIVLGSTSQRIAHHAKCAVLTVV
ncbi:MAG: universal stress protein [Rhodobacteraceae bacterium]|nr:universal stress protein [Paracoccaceae bacterium]MAY45111.1 universal stress protein [Paracoccaceae bacterium]QEW23059.1 Stress response protein NhaX [Marinibacterium anthonyi]|tara:strand:- start:1187 stop:1633 length:447 start_codon:yes stop_codon:yes gene_type:complete